MTTLTSNVKKLEKLEKLVRPTSTIAMVYGMKLLKVGTAYVSANVCSNFMAQIYMDKVLVSQENPQPLTNFIIMYIVIDMIMTVVVISIFFILSSFVGVITGDAITMILQDTAWFMSIIGVIGFIVASTMHNKKYFMYKDDGLRAIRALKDIMFQIGAFLALFPFFKLN
jgi:formate-dependent nitrite reductase membrane component NrfD